MPDFQVRPTLEGVPLSGDVLPEDSRDETDDLDAWPEGVSSMKASTTADWNALGHDCEVFTVRSDDGGMQILADLQGERAYQRFYRFGWSDWQSFSLEGHFHKELAPQDTDFLAEDDTPASTGIFWFPVEGTSNWGPNAGEFGHVLVEYTDNTFKQTFTRASDGQAFTRYHNGSTWSAWSSGGSSDADTLEGEDGAYYLDRTNHTGTQALGTITGHDKAAHDALDIDADTLDGHDTAYFAVSGAAPTAHAASHTNGTDDIQNATSAQKGLATAAQITKLDGIETGATADQTAAEILTAVKTVDGSGSGLDADLLDGSNSSAFASSTHATAHVTGGSDVIATAVAGGNAGLMSGTDKTKLDGVESGATADQTAAEILTAVKTVDGTGSGLDADLLDGHDTAFFAAAGAAPTAHAASHTNGTDDIQNATSAQKGLATAAQITKLDGIETAATADMTASEILTALLTVDTNTSGLNADTLDGVQGSGYVLATDYEDGDVLAKLLNVDGAGSLLDADKLDGQEGTYYTNASNLAGGTVPTARLGTGTADATTVLYGNNTWGAAPGGSGGGAGETTVNFGTFPGANDASATVTGQTGILSGSVVNAWLSPKATADHSADEHLVESIAVRAGNIVAGTGFTIYGINDNQLQDPAGQTPMITGLWTVGWRWA